MSPSADVVVPVFRNTRVTRTCLEALTSRTGDECRRIVIVNDASPEADMQPMLEEMQRRHSRIVLMRNATNLGFVQSANLGLAIRAGDVVLLNSDTEVTSGWLEEMLAVAHADDAIAAVCPLTNNGHFSSVPDFLQPNDRGAIAWDTLELERLPRTTTLPTAVGFCLLLRDKALNLLGPFDPAYGRGYNEENDWLQRARRQGFDIVRANRAMVFHLGAVSFGSEREGLDARNTGLLNQRYPRFVQEADEFGATTRARVASHGISRQAFGLSACIDLRGAGREMERRGRALSRALGDVGVRVSLRNGEQPAPGRVQILHRLTPISSASDLSDFLRPSLHAIVQAPDDVAPEELRFAPTYAALQAAQAILTTSTWAKQRLERRLRLPEERIFSIPLGVDAELWAQEDAAARRAFDERFPSRNRYWICVTDWHASDNLRWLLTAYERHRGAQPDSPVLVVASRDPRPMVDDGRLPPGVHLAPSLEEPALRAGLQGAVALVTARTNDGVAPGLLEAMAAGAPVVCPDDGPAAEYAGDAALRVPDFDLEAWSKALTALSSTPDLRARRGAHGRRRASALSWEATARSLSDLYSKVVESPPEASLLMRQTLAQLFREP